MEGLENIMVKHIVMWKLKEFAEGEDKKASKVWCRELIKWRLV
jgi:hypothetical protein